MKLALIPARGGSKRIPRKNIKNFFGKPIIEYSICAALNSGCFDEVIVSTDDLEIAEISKNLGAKVPFLRPSTISDDYSTTADVVKHAISWYEEIGQKIQYVCCIYATSPFIRSADIVEGLSRLTDTQDAMYAFSITSFPFPIQRGVIFDNGKIKALYPEYSSVRSQDLPEAFHDAGQFYWGKAAAYLSDVPLFSEASVGIEIPRYRSQDIDTLDDWKRAEVMYKVLNELGE